MLTIKEIKKAQAKVRSGLDFPAFLRELKLLGVLKYETKAADGRTLYFGNHGESVLSVPKYNPVRVADKYKRDRFLKGLSAHQRGETDYLTFCRHCAAAGVDRWVVDLSDMTCTYYNKAGDRLLVESISEAANALE